jgi:hypothetical protein
MLKAIAGRRVSGKLYSFLLASPCLLDSNVG